MLNLSLNFNLFRYQNVNKYNYYISNNINNLFSCVILISHISALFCTNITFTNNKY